MITPEGITVWAGLAFALWLAITLALHYVVRRQRAAGIVAPLLHWLDSHL
jgi:hypothetical protein